MFIEMQYPFTGQMSHSLMIARMLSEQRQVNGQIVSGTSGQNALYFADSAAQRVQGHDGN